MITTGERAVQEKKKKKTEQEQAGSQFKKKAPPLSENEEEKLANQMLTNIYRGRGNQAGGGLCSVAGPID